MFSFRSENEASFLGWVNGKIDILNKRKDINAKAAVVVDGWIQRNFTDQGKEFGGWQSLSDATLSIRQTRKSAPTESTLILMDKGQLKTRWKHLYNDQMAAVQSGVPYARIHNEGGWIMMFGRSMVKIPKRQILPEREMILPKLLKLYRDWAKDKLKLVAK